MLLPILQSAAATARLQVNVNLAGAIALPVNCQQTALEEEEK